jgi:hypothetical protein
MPLMLLLGDKPLVDENDLRPAFAIEEFHRHRGILAVGVTRPSPGEDDAPRRVDLAILTLDEVRGAIVAAHADVPAPTDPKVDASVLDDGVVRSMPARQRLGRRPGREDAFPRRREMAADFEDDGRFGRGRGVRHAGVSSVRVSSR